MRIRLLPLLAALLGATAASAEWLGPEKFLHLTAASGITTIGAGMTHDLFRVDYHHGATYGAAAAVAVGVLKEIYDAEFGETRRFDLRDLAVDVAGAGIGAASIELTASGFAWPQPKTAGEVMTAASYAMLAGTLLTSVAVLPRVAQERRRLWYLPLGLVGTGGAALLVGSYFTREKGGRF